MKAGKACSRPIPNLTGTDGGASEFSSAIKPRTSGLNQIWSIQLGVVIVRVVNMTLTLRGCCVIAYIYCMTQAI